MALRSKLIFRIRPRLQRRDLDLGSLLVVSKELEQAEQMDWLLEARRLPRQLEVGQGSREAWELQAVGMSPSCQLAAVGCSVEEKKMPNCCPFHSRISPRRSGLD